MTRLTTLALAFIFHVLPFGGDPFRVVVRTNDKETAWRSVLWRYPLGAYAITLDHQHWPK